MTDTAPVVEDQPALDGMPELDTQPDEKAPRARAPRTRAKSTTSRPRRAKAVDIAGKLTEMYTAIGIGVSMIPSGPSKFVEGVTGTQALGRGIADQAPKAAKAWADLADENPQVREVLEKLLTVSTFGALFAAHAPLLVLAGGEFGAVPVNVAAPMIAMLTNDEDGPAS